MVTLTGLVRMWISDKSGIQNKRTNQSSDMSLSETKKPMKSLALEVVDYDKRVELAHRFTNLYMMNNHILSFIREEVLLLAKDTRRSQHVPI